jgi:hypothetical protein
MKNSIKLAAACLLALVITLPDNLSAQENSKSDVHKEYDEHGNLISYDSTWSWSYHSDTIINYDSVMHEFFGEHWIDSGFFHDSFQMFPDSTWNLFHSFEFPYEFRGHHLQPFPLDSLFSMPFKGPMFGEHGFPDLFGTDNFSDFDELLRDHMERMREFFHEYQIAPDSLHFLHPFENFFPGDQNAPPGTIWM